MPDSRCDTNRSGLEPAHASTMMSTSTVCEPARAQAADNKQRRLSTVIETDIIPRLLLAHRQTAAAPEIDDGLPVVISSRDILGFVEVLLARPYEDAYKHVLGLLQKGLPTKRLLLEVLAPAAAHLGEMWSTDETDFLAVTVSLSSLHRIVHDVCDPTLDDDAPTGPSILLAPAPGEQHVFGLLIVSELFRRAGWTVTGGVPTGHFDVVRAVRQHVVQVVGLSMSTDRFSSDARALIGDIRRASCNPDVVILLGGNAFVNNPALAASLGGDFGTADAEEAVGFASRHFARMRV